VVFRNDRNGLVYVIIWINREASKIDRNYEWIVIEFYIYGSKGQDHFIIINIGLFCSFCYARFICVKINLQDKFVNYFKSTFDPSYLILLNLYINYTITIQIIHRFI
jgi:hypothetical protein